MLRPLSPTKDDGVDTLSGMPLIRNPRVLLETVEIGGKRVGAEFWGLAELKGVRFVPSLLTELSLTPTSAFYSPPRGMGH